MKKTLAVLAGGYGIRISAITKNQHKSLIKLPDQTTIISRVLIQAKNSEFDKVYLVHFASAPTGLIETAMKTTPKLGMSLDLLEQNPIKEYGTLYALRLICSHSKSDENILVFEGDVVISNQIAKKIFSINKRTFFIDDQEKYDSESMKVKLENGSIKLFGKEILGFPEFCAILLLDKRMRDLFISESEKVTLQKPFYEYAFNNMIKKGIKLPYTVIPESEWNEVDDDNDYNDLMAKYKLWNE